MNKLQKEIAKIEKKKGTQAYAYSVKKLGLEDKTVKEMVL